MLHGEMSIPDLKLCVVFVVVCLLIPTLQAHHVCKNSGSWSPCYS
jgi:hypothetical protein